MGQIQSNAYSVAEDLVSLTEISAKNAKSMNAQSVTLKILQPVIYVKKGSLWIQILTSAKISHVSSPSVKAAVNKIQVFVRSAKEISYSTLRLPNVSPN